MRVLLDTHVLVWWLMDSDRLSPRACVLIADPDQELVWSSVSTWELAIKTGLGRIELGRPCDQVFPRILEERSLTPLAMQHEHAVELAGLPHHHRDPFDRMLVAQARVEDLSLLTRDRSLSRYAVTILW